MRRLPPNFGVHRAPIINCGRYIIADSRLEWEHLVKAGVLENWGHSECIKAAEAAG